MNSDNHKKPKLSLDIKRSIGNGVRLVLIFILTFFFGLVFKHTNIL